MHVKAAPWTSFPADLAIEEKMQSRGSRKHQRPLLPAGDAHGWGMGTGLKTKDGMVSLYLRRLW